MWLCYAARDSQFSAGNPQPAVSKHFFMAVVLSWNEIYHHGDITCSTNNCWHLLLHQKTQSSSSSSQDTWMSLSDKIDISSFAPLRFPRVVFGYNFFFAVNNESRRKYQSCNYKLRIFLTLCCHVSYNALLLVLVFLVWKISNLRLYDRVLHCM